MKERIGNNCEIILTDELAKAFEMVDLPLTDEMVQEEQKVISIQEAAGSMYENYKKVHDYLSKVSTPIVTPVIPDYLSNFNKVNEAFKGITAMQEINKGLENWRKFNKGLNLGNNEENDGDDE